MSDAKKIRVSPEEFPGNVADIRGHQIESADGISAQDRLDGGAGVDSYEVDALLEAMAHKPNQEENPMIDPKTGKRLS